MLDKFSLFYASVISYLRNRFFFFIDHAVDALGKSISPEGVAAFETALGG